MRKSGCLIRWGWVELRHKRFLERWMRHHELIMTISC